MTMRNNVPVPDDLTEGLQSIQNVDRDKNRAFAGVNILFFGDFWQLHPTGSVSFMSNPCNKTGSDDNDADDDDVHGDNGHDDDDGEDL
eukprot:8662544-Karenia_brevis.AAC.1